MPITIRYDIHGTMLQDKRIILGMVTNDSRDFQRYFRRGLVSVDVLLSRGTQKEEMDIDIFDIVKINLTYCGI